MELFDGVGWAIFMPSDFSIELKEKIGEFHGNVHYLDNPYILDNIRYVSSVESIKLREYDHQELLLKALGKNPPAEGFELEADAAEIINCLHAVCHGRLIESAQWHNLQFVGDESADVLDVVKLPSGLKPFLLLLRLLENGSIRSDTLLILEEPECHLHPMLQLKLAEILVLMQKRIGLKIVLTTYSPYFLKAIEICAEKHDICNCCKYYRTSADADGCRLEDVGRDAEKIFADLAEPGKAFNSAAAAD